MKNLFYYKEIFSFYIFRNFSCYFFLPSSVLELLFSLWGFFCLLLHLLILYSGEVIYNRKDSDGCRFYAICSPTCTIERHAVDCNVTTPLTTTSPEWSTITTTVPLPRTSGRLPFPGCVSATYPPLQVCNFCVML